MIAHDDQDGVVKMTLIPQVDKELQVVVIGNGHQVVVVVGQLVLEGEGEFGVVLVHRHEVVDVVEDHL